MIDVHSLRRTVLLGVVGAVSMAVLLPGLALMRDTSGHDWYAAGKLIVTEAMIAVGFDPWAQTEYRAADGSVRRVTRFRFAYTVEAWMARSHILSTITNNAFLGAGAGSAGAILLAILSGVVVRSGRREWASTALAQPVRPDRRLATRGGSGFAEVLPGRTEGGTSFALMVAPVEIDRTTGAPQRVGNAALLPAAESGGTSTRGTSTPWLPEGASAGRNADAEASKPGDAPKPDPGGARKPSSRSVESLARQGSGRDGGTVAKPRGKRPGPHHDGGWY
jgi:hypothetical protein